MIIDCSSSTSRVLALIASITGLAKLREFCVELVPAPVVWGKSGVAPLSILTILPFFFKQERMGTYHTNYNFTAFISFAHRRGEPLRGLGATYGCF